MQSMQRSQLRRVGLGAALLAALLWAYRDAFTAGLTNWDDDRFLTANPLFAAGLWLGAIVVVVATLEARLTERQVASWQDSHALWDHAVAAQPEAFLAHVKYAQVLEFEQRWTDALSEVRKAAQLNPGNPLPSERLLHLHAKRDELAGALPAGTALRWLQESERAVADRAAYQQLAAEIDATSCHKCGDALVLMGLGLWPHTDAELLDDAAHALDQHLTTRARIWLSQVHDRSSARYAQLGQRAQASGEQ